jgi:aspartate/methionine/tyrosine aminotransferase
MRFIARTLNEAKSPISTAEYLSAQYKGNRSLLDMSQGAPNYPTAPAIAEHIAKTALAPDGNMYTARAGLKKLRQLVANELSVAYGGAITYDQVLITAGCNQAFCIAVSALADSGDEVILSVPYYFNHNMWLRLDRLSPVYLETAPHFIPDPHLAEAMITSRTRAIILVTPGNPTGVTVPPEVIEEFAELAKRHHIVLILDETYRAFRTSDEPPHNLFKLPGWTDVVISLHSFSKEFAIPGCRVGAAVCSAKLIVEMMKLSDCISICAPRLGQEAAIAALTQATDWRHEQAQKLREKMSYFQSMMTTNRPGGFELCSVGAFYGWVRHPFLGKPTADVAQSLLAEHAIAALPGTVFTPMDDRYLRFSYSNLSIQEIDDLGERLRNIS